MYTFGEKLTSVAVVDQLLCIGHNRGQEETCSESLTDQGAGGSVIAASATMDFVEQFNTCFLSDALH
jgi:hypothetical protein